MNRTYQSHLITYINRGGILSWTNEKTASLWSATVQKSIPTWSFSKTWSKTTALMSAFHTRTAATGPTALPCLGIVRLNQQKNKNRIYRRKNMRHYQQKCRNEVYTGGGLANSYAAAWYVGQMFCCALKIKTTVQLLNSLCSGTSKNWMGTKNRPPMP